MPWKSLRLLKAVANKLDNLEEKAKLLATFN